MESSPVDTKAIKDFDDFISKIGTQAPQPDEVIPAPGEPGNEFIGVNRVVRGQEVFHAFSGKERRRIVRANQRAEAKQQQAGQRAYNRQQRQAAFQADTRRQQLRILKGELTVSPDMYDNLLSAVEREQKLFNRKANEQTRLENAAKRRSERLHDRRIARADVNRSTHRDLVALGIR